MNSDNNSYPPVSSNERYEVNVNPVAAPAPPPAEMTSQIQQLTNYAFGEQK